MTAPLRLLALTCAATLTLVGCKKQEEQAAPPPPDVGVIDAKPQTLPLQRELVGRLSPYRSADVRARVAGVLQKRVYEEGSNVKEGQVLFLIDPAQLQAALNQAEGALAAARATYANARATATRARSLAPQKYVSQSDLDNAVAAERSGAASVQQAEAAVANARINLGYARVTSPITGLAGKAQVTEGALVGQGDVTLLTTVDQIDPLYVNFSMTADEMSALRAAQDKGALALAGDGKTTVQVNLPDGTPYAHEGTLDFSAPTVDPATGAISLRAQLPNPDHLLLPGTFVSFNANLGQRHNAFLIPQQAVQRDTQGGYVLVVGADGNVVRKNVVLGNQQGSNWLVSSGLEGGDKVIVSGIQKVKAGAPAKPSPWQPQAATKPGAAVPAPEKKE
ncbi:GntR family transcriptional regulator [Stenotrophomonas humi]|uniref:GntR family transcriptional regulator n=1 Tax=Stenotrophomonas humi TaxID=405444 RepID=A0A0R0CAD7_9GAMM|nr:GntR family transcriptional regulator [Stenotrophomonas humi]